MKDLILIKLGGSLITDKTKPFTLKPFTLKRLCQEIHGLKLRSKASFIIGHGGGSFPHVPAKKFRILQGVVNSKSILGIAEVQDAAARLNRIVVSEFIKAKVLAISFNPSSLMLCENGEIKRAFLGSLEKSLELGMTPVVYGDVCFDLRKGCTILSTEKILNFLALKFRKKYRSIKIVYCGITRGVYDDKGHTIKNINSSNFGKIKSLLGTSQGIDVTGGMLHKVEEALKVARKGIPILIIDATKPGEIERSVLDEGFEGTLIS